MSTLPCLDDGLHPARKQPVFVAVIRLRGLKPSMHEHTIGLQAPISKHRIASPGQHPISAGHDGWGPNP